MPKPLNVNWGEIRALACSGLSFPEISQKTGIELTRRLAEGAKILQINMLDHVIIGRLFNGHSGYFSFKEAGLV
jgi:RadC-like JAB domain